MILTGLANSKRFLFGHLLEEVVIPAIDVDGPDDGGVRKFLKNSLFTTPLGAQPSRSLGQENPLQENHKCSNHEPN